MSLPFNTLSVWPRQKDLLDLLKRDIFLTLNCHAVATVQSVNTDNVTLTAQMNYCKTISDSSGNQTTQNYQLLADIPIWFPCGGQTSLTMPVAPGDQVLVCFNDRDLDNWIDGARGGQVNSPRLHSFSDGIALVGLNDISGWDAVRALLTDGSAKLGINPNTHKITITNGTSLLSILQTLITGILGLTVPSAPGGVVDTTGDVASAMSQLGELLE